MGNLHRLLKNMKRTDLLVTPRIEAHVLRNPRLVLTKDEAENWLVPLVTSTANDRRDARFGASSRGMCHRRQVFAFLGMPVTSRLDLGTLAIFEDGTWRHMRWQMLGMKAGVFTDVEVVYKVPELNLTVSIDAINSNEGWLFELKGSSNWSSTLDGVPQNHLLQIHTYFLATGYDRCSYVVEDKRSQNWREIIVTADQDMLDEVRDELEDLNRAVTRKVLPMVKSECVLKEGEYKNCPYAASCIKHKRVSDRWPDDRKWDD